jgi:hypothetical protein
MSILRIAAAAAVVAALAACSAELPTATPLTAGNRSRARVTTRAGRPTLVSNRVKYRDSGLKPAFARAGTAALTVQALMGLDGLTTVDMTTATPDAASTGLLTNVQLKQFDAQGHVQTVTNRQGIGAASARIVVPGSTHGSRLQVQAIIRAVDGSHIDVIAVNESVKFRPDVGVVAMVMEPQSVRGGLAIIDAYYQELRGDLGANVRCVLYVDGVAVDGAQAVWIDAGGFIGCQFLYRFPSNGVHQVTAAADGVDPGDYDPSNNTRSATITIVDPAPVPASNQFSWDANVSGTSDLRGTYSGDGWARNAVTGEGSDNRFSTEYKGQDAFWVDIGGQSPRSLVGPIDVHFTDRVDGTVLHDDAFNESNPASDQRSHYEFGSYRQDCSLIFRTQDVAGEGGTFTIYVGQVIVCSSRDVALGQDLGTWFTYFAQGGQAVYFSDNFSHSFGPDYENTYAFTGDVEYSYGTYAFGHEYAFQITFTDATQQLVAAGAMPIWTREVSEVQPYTCTDYRYIDWTVHNCLQSNATWTAFRAIGVAPSP